LNTKLPDIPCIQATFIHQITR